ncbi:hypothetical protein RIF29_29682 [Crotalaria pallida]|uniref:RNase H type-1 domain-containing protein n=1 Tax=Crotalaria pallida TaxID=3830 RepID=A0AAN9EFE6_CROPI
MLKALPTVSSTRVLMAELLAIRKGLSFAWARGYNHVICKSDSKVEVRLVSMESCPQFHLFGAIIHVIQTKEEPVPTLMSFEKRILELISLQN